MRIRQQNDEVSKWKKKSKKRGLKRADHKHDYIHALVTTRYHFYASGTISATYNECTIPREVCATCSRIGKSLENAEYWNRVPDSNCKFAYRAVLTEAALALPKYTSTDFEKFAHKVEEDPEND